MSSCFSSSPFGGTVAVGYELLVYFILLPVNRGVFMDVRGVFIIDDDDALQRNENEFYFHSSPNETTELRFLID